MSQIFRSLPNDAYQAAINANSPSASNPFLTQSDIPTITGGLFAQTANGATVSGSVGADLIGSGVGSVSIPANGFQIGDSFHVAMGCEISCANNQQLIIEVRAGSILLATTGVVTLSTLTNKHLELEIDFTIRSIGGPGVASIMSVGTMSYVKDSSLSYEGTTFNTLNNTTFDTTVSNTLVIKATWDTLNVANSIYSTVFVLSKTY